MATTRSTPYVTPSTRRHRTRRHRRDAIDATPSMRRRRRDAVDATPSNVDATPSTRHRRHRRDAIGRDAVAAKQRDAARRRVVREARVAASITSVDRQPVAQRRDVEGVLGLAFTSPFEQFVLIHHLAPILADLLALVDRDPSSQPEAHRARVVDLDGRVGSPLNHGIRAREAAAFPRFFGLLRPSRSPLGRLS